MVNKTIFWSPKKDECIEGVYVDKLSNVGKFKTTLYKIQNNDAVYCIWGRVQLDSIMESAKIGDDILVRFCGNEKTKDGNYMKRYELEILNENDE